MRKLQLGLALCLLGGCRQATVDVAEQPLVGGTLTTGYPFVGYVSADYGGSSSGCTGTLVRDRWVLTASHCIEENSGPVIGVKVTFEADSDKATVWHTAKSWKQHPNYGKPVPPDSMYYINRGYDCALVELDTAVTGVTPIPYGTAAMDATWVGKPVTQVGYGFTTGNFTGSGLKRELATHIADVHDGVLGLDENGTGTCQGDSGGPTLYDAGGGVIQVIGVSSYGSPGCPGGGWMSRTELCTAWLDTVAGPLQASPDMADPPQSSPDLSPPPGTDGGPGGVGSGGSGDPGSSGGGSSSGAGNPVAGTSSGCQFAGGARDSAPFVFLALGVMLIFRSRRRRREG